ncbi:MAG TPA: CapA family protein [Steroidobacteraceae bacterium]|nr:CapA family protein [Steroidobacteraceae bacterium]
MNRSLVSVVITLLLGHYAALADEEQFGPADPGVRDTGQFDPKRPIEGEMQANVPDGFSAAAVGDLIISRPLSQHAEGMPSFAAVLAILRGTDVTFGNLETTIFDPRTFIGAPYSWDGDWTNASVPAVAGDLKAMGFDIVGRANNHSQDWGLEGMRETAHWLDEAGIPHAGAGESHRMARAPAYFESPAGRIAVVSFASTFRPTSESMPSATSAPGRPGLSALHVQETTEVPRSVVEALAKLQCTLYGTRCTDVPREGNFFGTAYRQAEKYSHEHTMDPQDLAEIYAAIRSAQQNADFVIAAIHAHQCSTGCDDDDAPRGAANFLKELAHGAIDSGADLFVTTGNHNLGPMEIYDSPARGKRPIFYGLGNFFWSDVQEQLPADLHARNRGLLEKAWKDPAKATDYDLTAPLNTGYFDHAFTFQSVIAEVRFSGNALSEVVLHPVELGYGDPLTRSGIPRLVTDDSTAREILDQVVQQTARFGLPALDLQQEGQRGVVAVGR